MYYWIEMRDNLGFVVIYWGVGDNFRELNCFVDGFGVFDWYFICR